MRGSSGGRPARQREFAVLGSSAYRPARLSGSEWPGHLGSLRAEPFGFVARSCSALREGQFESAACLWVLVSMPRVPLSLKSH